MALIDNRSKMTQASRDLPVATRSPLPPLGKGTVGPNISPYAVAAAQAKPQQAKPVVKAAPLAPVAPPKRYDTPDIPSIAPSMKPGVQDPTPLVKYAPITPYVQKAGLAMQEQMEKEKADIQKKNESKNFNLYSPTDEESAFASVQEKLESGEFYISEDDLDDKFSSMDAEADLAMQEQMDMMDSQMAAMGLTGTGARGVAMGNIRAKILADLNSQKSDLWLKTEFRNTELAMTALQTEMHMAAKEGDWDHAEGLLDKQQEFQMQIEMMSAMMQGMDMFVAWAEKYSWEAGAMENALAYMESAYATGDMKSVFRALGGFKRRANGSMTWEGPSAQGAGAQGTGAQGTSLKDRALAGYGMTDDEYFNAPKSWKEQQDSDGDGWNDVWDYEPFDPSIHP